MLKHTRRFLSFHRALSTSPRLPIVISEEVQQALNDKITPVVSLESTIITHGLPYPENLSMATEVETLIRDLGAVPATCAFIGGVPYVGLSDRQLAHLAESATQKTANKVSRRDIGYTLASKSLGGTTISLTMILSHLAGIKVFATGGLGGVHKDGQYTMDVSADLTELGRTPVSVVCAGPKSILDIGLTMEYLETQGVFVGTYNDNGRTGVQVPGFYCRSSGVLSPYTFSSFSEAASIVHQSTNVMGLNSGNLLCIPPPEESALDSEFIDEIIANANEEANSRGISGKELTPFLLGKIAKDTGGRSVECNVKFVLNNVKCASEIAKELLRLEKGESEEVGSGKEVSFSEVSSGEEISSDEKGQRKTAFQPSTRVLPKEQIPAKNTDPSTGKAKSAPSSLVHPNRANTVVIGSLALDTISTIAGNTFMGDSNPGTVKSSIGGVGYNVSLAHSFSLQSLGSSSSCRLVSAVADDFGGRNILSQLKSGGVDTTGIAVFPADEARTAQYNSTHGNNGDLLLAVADMSIVELAMLTDHIKSELERAQPQQVVMDCNLSPSILSEVLDFVQQKWGNNTTVVVEPTSAPKAARLGHINSRLLQVFPNNLVQLITPTIEELGVVYSSFSERELFDDYDLWFPVLDSLGVNTEFRERLVLLSRKKEYRVLQKLADHGVLQQSFQLLPYIPNILVKMGSLGVLYIGISTSITDYESLPTTSPYRPQFTILSKGTKFYDDGVNKQMGLVVQYFPIPVENEGITVANVTGAGDSFLGYLSARLAVEKEWLNSEIDTVEEEWGKWESIHRAQVASGLSIRGETAVSDQIKNI